MTKKTFFLAGCMLMMATSLTAAQSYLDQNKLVVDDDALVYTTGNVGIATANPVQQFEVVGDTTFRKTAGFSQAAITRTGGAFTVNWVTSGNKIRISISGNNTFSFAALPESGVVTLILAYTGTGSVTWSDGSSDIAFPFGQNPILTFQNGAIDILTFYYSKERDTYYGVGAFDFE